MENYKGRESQREKRKDRKENKSREVLGDSEMDYKDAPI